MTTFQLRFLLILLALLNVVVAIMAFAGVASQPDQGEPARLDNQIKPDLIGILGQAQTPASIKSLDVPTTGESVCLAWPNLGDLQNKRLIALLSGFGVEAKVRDAAVPTAWSVRTTRPVPTLEAAEILADTMVSVVEVERSRLRAEEIAPRKFVVVLGVFDRRSLAEELLGKVKERGLNDVDIAIARTIPERRVEATMPEARAEAVLAGQPFVKRHKSCQE